jgi:hypothetical protein
MTPQWAGAAGIRIVIPIWNEGPLASTLDKPVQSRLPSWFSSELGVS